MRAHADISEKNRSLSQELVWQRDQTAEARENAARLMGENLRVRETLSKAESAIMIAERRLWESLETIQDGFAVWDRNRVMVAANRAYLSVFDGLDEVGPGIHIDTLLALAVEEGIVDLEGRTTATWRVRMARRWDGREIDPLVLKLWDGTFVRVADRWTRDGDLVQVCTNITGAIRRERQLRRARDRAEAASRAKSAFLANMSHEIRTPMNGVIGMADLLTETGLTEDQKLYVDTIRSSGEALLVIINDVLDYSKIEANKLKLREVPFDLERTIHEVLTLLQPTAQDKGLQLIADYDLFMPTEFTGDPGRIRQILTNLAGNAVKFTENGHVAIRVVGLPVDGGARWRCHITVEDTGIGIPKDKLKSIWGEFDQAEGDRNRSHDGTGLGLAITKRLVGLMGGEIWVESEVGRGSGFGFHVAMPAAGERGGEVAEAPDWIGRAIVVDEPSLLRTVLAKQLTAIGVRTETASDLSRLAALSPTPVDVLFFGDGGAARTSAAAGRRVLLTKGPQGAGADGADAALAIPARRQDIRDLLAALTPPASPGGPGDEAIAPVFFRRSRRAETAAARQAVGRMRSEPRAPDPLPVPDPVRPPAPVAGPAGRPPGPGRAMRVLAAEDNATNRLVFQKMVQTLDLDLVFAVDGAEAVDRFAEAPPDLVFTDISMPNVDGLEATRRIRAIEADRGLPRTPVVAMTAHAMEGDGASILSAGLDHYLTKPLKKAAVIDRILAACPEDARPPLGRAETAAE